MTRSRKDSYTTRLQKGGALLDDMRLIVRSWQEGAEENWSQHVSLFGALGKRTRSRAADTIRRAFLPRFVNGSPPEAWKMLRPLEDAGFSVEIVRPVYYWVTARSERILYDFVCEELHARYQRRALHITTTEVVKWISRKLADQGRNWSDAVTTRVARGILATLRDFGLLRGKAPKEIAPAYLPFESFAYIAFALYKQGIDGISLVEHSDWSLFLIDLPGVEGMFVEADRHGLLRYEAAGRIVRVDFPATNYEEMAGVLARRKD